MFVQLSGLTGCAIFGVIKLATPLKREVGGPAEISTTLTDVDHVRVDDTTGKINMDPKNEPLEVLFRLQCESSGE